MRFILGNPAATDRQHCLESERKARQAAGAETMRKTVQEEDIAEIHPEVYDLEKENHSRFPLS
jgi:hypothetical protein